MLVREAIERCFNEFLYPAGIDRPAFDILEGAINSSVTSLVTEGRQTYVPQSLIEFQDDTMEVALTREAESTTTVDIAERGYMETTAGSHSDGALILIDPEYHRQTVFNAIAHIVGQLYPLGLYIRATSATTSVSTGAAFALESAAKEVLSVMSFFNSQWVKMKKGIDYEVLTDFDTIKMQFYSLPSSTVNIVYKKDFTTPALVTDDLTTTCGVPSTLAPYIPMGAAGYLLQGREVPQVFANTMMERLNKEGVPVGSALNVGQALLQGFERRYVAAERTRLREQNPNQFRYVS